MSEIQKIITAHGGTVAFSQKYKIPLRTVQAWNAGRRTPPNWVTALITNQKGLTAKDVDNG